LRRAQIVAVFAGVAIAAAAAGIYVHEWNTRHSPLPFGTNSALASSPKPVPPLEFEDAQGRKRTLAEFRGRMVVLNIWATWCAPCREEMPALDRLQAKLGGPSFQVLAVSVDQQGPEVARRFYQEIGVKSLDFYIDRSARAAFRLDAPGLPVSLLIDRQGREIGRKLGAAEWDAPQVVEELRRRIAPPE
jgi:thiol-disulfide isomerase/thioredoxin